MGCYEAGYQAGVARCEHLEREVARLKERVAELERRPYCHDEQTWVPVVGYWCSDCGYVYDQPGSTDCDCWEYVDWTFGDLEPGDWFEHDGVEWKKVECHYWANARSGDVVDRFFEDEVVYPFEWGD